MGPSTPTILNRSCGDPYNWRRDDEAFHRDWDAAIDACTDRLEARLQELALEGDVTALIFMLKARKPEIYNPNLLLRQQMFTGRARTRPCRGARFDAVDRG